MWKYILLLAIFNLGYGASLLTDPTMTLIVKSIPLYAGMGHYIAAVGFLLAGLLCLVEVIYRLGRGQQAEGLLLFRFIAQGVSLALSLSWLAGVALAFFVVGGPVSSITSWLLIAVGQAVMLRPADLQPNSKQAGAMLRKTLEEEQGPQ